MADGIENNLFLINAPAGSGKTTTIFKRIETLVRDENCTSVLCITYTRRAVEELQRKLEGYSVKIMTIHAFLAEFMKPYFGNPKIVQLYLKIYKNEIENQILKDNKKREESKNWNKFIEKYGLLVYETVEKNIERIYYNEREFNGYYYGGLGHDGLLYFALQVIKTYPIVGTKLTECYKHIFIDEYQDTSADVLKFFYSCVKDSDTRLYLFGDRMQQIYNKYDGSFEKEFGEFDSSEKLRINYRSTPAIIDLLNNIYNNPEYRQIPDKAKVVSENEKPRLIITEHMDECVEREEAKIAGEVLKLYITNRERFKKINAEDLFRKVENLTDEDGNKLYTTRRKYSVVDVMTASEEENPEALFRFMWILDKILQCYEQKNYGAVIQILRNRDGGKDKFFKTSALDIKIHEDKKKLKETLENINEIYTGNQKKSVLDLLNFLRVKRIIDPMLFSEDMYQDILSVDVLEFLNLFRAIDAKIISTQHGVKGEGHNNVFFIAEDNSYLNVDMYGFFEMLTKIPVEFQSFQDFYYDYKKKIENLYCVVGKNFLESAQVYKECFPKIKPHIDEINNQLQDNDYYKYIYQDSYKVIEKKGAVLKYMQEFSKTSKIQNILLAYKLFYVGCSRAKKTLTVFVSENQIAHYKEDFRTTFKELGFDISEE